MIDEKFIADTLYLNKIALCNSGALHAQDSYGQ
jgi:hypothetical protein